MNKDVRDIVAMLSARRERAERVEGPAGLHTLATVVRVRGSSYRRCGARMLVHASGVVAGSVSGGCLEGEIARKGRWWAEHGPVVKRFDDEEVGCGGAIDVLIENVRADDEHGPIAALRWIAERRAAARMVTVIGGDRIGARHVATADEVWAGCESFAVTDDEVFVEDIDAPRELLVAGRHHDIAPVVRLARTMGWEVTNASRGVSERALGGPDHVIEPTPESVATWAAARPGAAIVLMTHDLALDGALLAAILPVAAPSYLGVLGPGHRTQRIVDEIARSAGVSPRALAAVRTPVGLDLGGDGPEAVALSIVADVQATWHARDGARLCAPGAGAWGTPRLVSVGDEPWPIVNVS